MTQLDFSGNVVRDIFGDELQERKIFVFHDESGDFTINSDWFYTGLLWINQSDITELVNDLSICRELEKCTSEIHYKNFRKTFEKPNEIKERLAKEWFNLWQQKWSKRSWFNVFAVNKKHKQYDETRFSEKFHAYNRFTAMTFKSGLAWFFQNYPDITLSICSDEKSREESDNFKDYLLARIQRDSEESRYSPNVKFDDPAPIFESCPKYGPYNTNQELLQLTDILLGSVSSAIEHKSVYHTKTWFGVKISQLMEDVRKKPWEQKYDLHKKFSVSYFPNEYGHCYNNGQVKVNETSFTSKTLSDFIS